MALSRHAHYRHFFITTDQSDFSLNVVVSYLFPAAPGCYEQPVKRDLLTLLTSLPVRVVAEGIEEGIPVNVYSGFQRSLPI
jgi:hypothetical protein